MTQNDDTLDGGYNSLDDGHDPLWSQERFGAMIMAEQILVANGCGTWQERQAARRPFPVGRRRAGKIAGKVCAKKIGSQVFLAKSRVFLAQILLLSRIIRIFGPDSRMDSSEGNLNRGFLMKNYPNFYFPNNPSLN